MCITTVMGAMDPEDLGITAPHEHIFVDCRKVFDEFRELAPKEFADQKVDISNLGVLRRNHRASRDNLFLSDPKVARRELSEFKKAGGQTIIELSTAGMARDPIGLRELSEELGINIVAGCGLYKEKFHPESVRRMSVSELTRLMIKEIQVGIDGTGIRAGIIGEIGVSKDATPREIDALRAAGAAQKETGAALSVHIDPWSDLGLMALDLLEKEGVDLGRVVICHVDARIDVNYCEALLKRGVMVEFDNFGKEYCGDLTGLAFARDVDRVQALKTLIDWGHVNQLLVSTDVCLKTDLRSFGGWGYDHILTNMTPIMRKTGITEDDLNTIMVENPRRTLDVTG